MDCEYFNKYISPYVDGMIDAKDKEALEKHLNQCSRCIAILHETREIIARVDELDEEILPADFHQSLLDRLGKGRNYMKSMKWFKTAGVIVAIIVLLFSVKVIGNWGSMDKGKGLDDGTIQEENHEKEEKPMIAMDENSIAQDKDTDNIEEKRESQSSKEDKDEGDVKMIRSESVEVYVQDVCITPQTLQFMAANNDLDLIEMEDSSATFGIKNDEHRVILYEELSKMGEVKETGDNIGGNQVKVVIISVMSETEGD